MSLFGNPCFLEGFEQVLQTVVPVGVRVQDVGANKLRRGISEGNVVSPDRDYEPRVIQPAFHHIAYGELLLNTLLCNIAGKYDDFLDGIVPENAIDLVPKVISAVQATLVDPDPISSHGELGGDPERELVILGSCVRNENRCS